jgi:translation elongation factor EF-Tu-like GTPase
MRKWRSAMAPFMLALLRMSKAYSQRIEAEIRLLPEQENHRRTPINCEFPYRPDHRFHGDATGSTLMGQVRFKEGKLLHPGESGLCEVTFCFYEEFKPFLKVGQQWDVMEGARVVGTGTVLGVI